MVVSLYRKAIDSYYKNGYVKIDEDELLKLKKIFNRNFTKGFLFNTDNNDLINGYRPNHMGVPIGKIIDYKKGIAKIKLSDNISFGSGLRVIGKKNDVGISVNEMYVNNKLVKKAYNIYKKTGNLTMKSLKKAGLDELVGIVDDINTIFSGDASLTDRIAAGVDLLVGIELNNKGAKKSLSITT